MWTSKVEQQDWNSVKKEIQKTWSGLHPEDLEKTGGDILALANLVERKCGVGHDQAYKELDAVICKCGTIGTVDGFNLEKTSAVDVPGVT